ncbi:MAG: hypothetical protein Q9217_001274 [Psora testacea]
MAKEHVASDDRSEPAPVLSHLSLPVRRPKLTGRPFYESLGSPKLVLAPMVDQSEFAWRKLTRSFMKPNMPESLLAYSPMLHARMFTETQKFRDRHFQPTKKGLASPYSKSEAASTPPYLDGNPKFDRPLLVQFCANSPDELLEAARYVEPYCDAVDLNLGCPQGIARKGNYGAFLQENWDLIYQLINKLHMNLDVPVTAKIRIFETKEKTLEYARMILAAGASIITVHGRKRDQKGHKTGLADWSVLRYLRENLPPDTVIFANGNILRHEDIQQCLERTGADGVMSAEGNLCDPTIFSPPPGHGAEGREYWRGRNRKGGYRMDAVFRRYMDIIYEHVLEKPVPQRKPLFLPCDPVDDTPSPDPPALEANNAEDQPPRKKQKRATGYVRPTSSSLLAIQPHLFHLLRPLVSQHTAIRDALAKSRAGDVPAFENVLQMTEAAVRQGLLDYDSDPAKYDEPAPIEEKAETGHEDEDEDESSIATVRMCKRPWWVCQPYVRPLPKEALENGSLTMSKKDKKQLEEEKIWEHGQSQKSQASEREKMDVMDGMPEQEMPKQAMVAG